MISLIFGQIGFCVERWGSGDEKKEEHHDGLQPSRLPEHDRQHGGVHGEGDRAVANQAAGSVVLLETLSGWNSKPEQVIQDLLNLNVLHQPQIRSQSYHIICWMKMGSDSISIFQRISAHVMNFLLRNSNKHINHIFYFFKQWSWYSEYLQEHDPLFKWLVLLTVCMPTSYHGLISSSRSSSLSSLSSTTSSWSLSASSFSGTSWRVLSSSTWWASSSFWPLSPPGSLKIRFLLSRYSMA